MDPGENLVLGLLPRLALAALFCVVTFLKASPWKSSRPLSAASGENSRSIDRMMMALWCRFPLEGIILEGVHWLKRPMDGFSSETVFHVTH